MTVKELIKNLDQRPQDAVVAIQDGDSVVWTIDDVKYYLEANSIVLEVGEVI